MTHSMSSFELNDGILINAFDLYTIFQVRRMSHHLGLVSFNFPRWHRCFINLRNSPLNRKVQFLPGDPNSCLWTDLAFLFYNQPIDYCDPLRRSQSVQLDILTSFAKESSRVRLTTNSRVQLGKLLLTSSFHWGFSHKLLQFEFVLWIIPSRP